MKVLFVVTEGELGGAQKYVLALAKHFGGSIAASTNSDWISGQAKKANIDFYQLKFLKRSIDPFYDFLAFFEILFLIRKVKPDILHLNSSKAGILGSLAGQLAGTKVVFTAHGFAFNEPRPKPVKTLFIFLEKISGYFRDHIIAVSDFDREVALKHHLITANKITTVHFGMDPLIFLDKPTARDHLSLPQNKIIIGTIANFYRTKGLDVLIKAAALLKTELVNFVVIGEGPERQKLEIQIETSGLKHKFFFLGSVENAFSYLKAFDLFVLPSRKEGLPLVLIEALQASMPIIATDVGGNKEVLGKNGMLIESENPEKMARAIEMVISDENLKRQLTEYSNLQSQKFEVSHMLAETSRIYNLLS